jgi:Kdo2-lipid IVA lauroyltransferase/acyltransferase
MQIKHKIEYFFFISFVKYFKLIGLNKTRHSANILGYILYYVIPIRKKVIKNNLNIAFPQKTETEIKRLTLKTYQNTLITFFELMYLPFVSKKEIDESVLALDIEIVKQKLYNNKSAIFLTGHFGGWEFCSSSLSRKIGRPFYMLAQPQSNSRISDYVMKARKAFGNEIILSGISVRKLYENLLKGEIVIIAGDQRGSYEGPRFSFFDRPTALYTGTASISLKTNCLVIMTAFERQQDNSYKIHFEELSFNNLPDNNEDKIRELTQRYISFLEKHIKKNPEQYFWLHKLWKY